VVNDPKSLECRDNLRMFMLTSCARNPGLECEEHHQLIEAKYLSDLQLHRGFHLTEIFGETCGMEETRTMLGGGYRLRRDYGEFFERLPNRIPPADERPYLIGLSRLEANTSPASYVSMFFVDSHAQFRFSAPEQALLRQALFGETDDQLAGSLEISLSSVKKRWAAIYERVEEMDPGIVP